MADIIELLQHVLKQVKATNESLLLIARMSMIGFAVLIVLLVMAIIWLTNRVRLIEEQLEIREKPEKIKNDWWGLVKMVFRNDG